MAPSSTRVGIQHRFESRLSSSHLSGGRERERDVQWPWYHLPMGVSRVVMTVSQSLEHRSQLSPSHLGGEVTQGVGQAIASQATPELPVVVGLVCTWGGANARGKLHGIGCPREGSGSPSLRLAPPPPTHRAPRPIHQSRPKHLTGINPDDQRDLPPSPRSTHL